MEPLVAAAAAVVAAVVVAAVAAAPAAAGLVCGSFQGLAGQAAACPECP